MNRNQLKQLWFNLDYSNVKECKTISVKLFKCNTKGICKITSEGPNGFSEFTTLQDNVMNYVYNSKEYNSNKYKLIINKI